MNSIPQFQSRLLLVGGSARLAGQTQRFLSSLGVECDYAANASEALERHRESPYRIVVVSGREGIDLCEPLRSGTGRPVYVLLIAPTDDAELQATAFRRGIDDVIVQPFRSEKLAIRIRLAERIVCGQEREMQYLATMNESLRLASRRFEALFSGLPVACFTVDADGKIYEWNRAAEDSFGIAAFDTLMRPVWELFDTEEETWAFERCEQILNGMAAEEFDWTYRKGNVEKVFTCRAIVLRSPSGQPVGAVCANVDITSRIRVERLLANENTNLENTNARLLDLASRDVLTGLSNRRSFLGDLDSAIHAFQTTGKPFSLVMLDIDNFKAYNDTFGHPAGDDVLRRFARILRATARSTEQPARYGGEEFAIVLHGTNGESGVLAANRFRRAVEEGDWTERDVTCSLGVATIGVNGTTAKEIVAAADAALYESKLLGRNRVTHALACDEERLAA